MNRTTLLLLPMFALVVLLPGATAAIGFEGQLAFSPDQRQVLLQQSFSGPDATWMRGSIDANGDGTVTATEVDRWQVDRTVEADASCRHRPFNFTRVNEDPVSWALPYTYAALSDAAGPTTSTETVGVTVVMSLHSEGRLRNGDVITVEMSRMDDIARMWDCLFAAPIPLDLTLRPTYVFIDLEGAPVVEPVTLMGAVTTKDGNGLALDDSEEMAIAYGHQIRFRYVEDPGLAAAGAGPFGPLGLTVGLAALLVLFASFASEPVRDRVLRFLSLVVPFFTRVKRENALDHERRERLYGYIRDHQGATFSDLRRALDLGSGSLSHHLRVLEGQGFVKTYRDGLRDRFYLYGPKVTPDEYLTRVQRALLEAIVAHPGIPQKELAKRLGLTRQSVQYHEKVLAGKGVLRAESAGRVRRYFPADGVDASV